MEREILARLEPLGPRLVVLFGSRAHDRATEGSDYDLMVVLDVPPGTEPRTPRVRMALGNLPAAFDIVVYTSEEWEAWRHHPLSFAHQIQETGRVLCAA